MFFFFTTPL
jgi:hypothetical protein